MSTKQPLKAEGGKFTRTRADVLTRVKCSLKALFGDSMKKKTTVGWKTKAGTEKFVALNNKANILRMQLGSLKEKRSEANFLLLLQ